MGDGGAIIGAHDAIREKETAHESGHEQILTEELLEKILGENVPSNRVRGGGENPREFAQWGPTIVQFALRKENN